MTTSHLPDPEFVRALEWEICSAQRRQVSLDGRCVPGPRRGLFIKGSVVVGLVSMFLGGAATYAVTRGWNSANAELLIAKAEIFCELAAVKLQHVQERAQHIGVLFDEGLVNRSEMEGVELDLCHAESDSRIQMLNLEEVQLSGKSPNDSLGVSLVAGRDFVSERLELERIPMGERLAQLQDRSKRVVGPDSEREAMQCEIDALALQLRAVDERIALRREFLIGRLSQLEVELRGMRVVANVQRQVIARQLENTKKQYQRVEELHSRGVIPESELSTNEVHLHSLELMLRVADLELQMIDEKLAISLSPEDSRR